MANDTKSEKIAPITPAPEGPSARETELLAKLEKAERAAIKAEERLQDHLSNADTTGLRVRNEKGPYRGENGGWLFRIGPMIPENHPHLAVMEEKACDESELKRWYCATQQDPPKSGKQVDPVKIHLRVECLDPGRAKLQLHKQALANIRAKLNSGTNLTDREQKLLSDNELEVLGFRQSDLD